MRNVVFPVTIKTYLYSEAPEIEEETPAYLTDDAASLDTAEEFGYDREVLQEAYARQIKANDRLERGNYHGCVYASDISSSTDSVSSDDPYYLSRDYSPAGSFESDRSWHYH